MPLSSRDGWSKFKYGPGRIDMSSQEGIFTYNEANHKYYIRGIAVTRKSQPRHNLSWALDGLLSGYKITIDHDPTLRTLSTAMLNGRADHIEDGEEYNTILAGLLIKATRDRSLNHLRSWTLERTMRPFDTGSGCEGMDFLASLTRKRKIARD